MKDIKLMSLELSNFKCHRHLKLDFNGGDASIYGDNATGKSSIYDALTWALFSKDSQGNGDKTIEIKPLGADGQVKDHEAITAVEAVLSCDGEETALKRTLREVWTTRRGSTELVYDGNVSDYFVDGVPCKKNAFDTKVKELCPEDLFRMLTSVSWFAAGMKWQDRRSVLFDMAGMLTDKEIMGKDSRFDALAESIGKLTVGEYKVKLLHQKRGLTGTRDDAPARISECQRQLDSMKSCDMEALREQERELIAKRDAISSEIIAIEQDAAVQSKSIDLRSAKADRDEILRQNQIYRDAQKSALPDKAALEQHIRREMVKADIMEGALMRAQKSVPRLQEQLEETRAKWVKVNGEAFAGGICPSCGQGLPFEKLREATENFEARKQKKLRDIEREADSLKERIREAEGEVLERTHELDAQKAEIEELNKQLKTAGSVEIVDAPGFPERMARAEEKILVIQKEIAQLQERSGDARAEKQKLLAQVTGELNGIWEVMSQSKYREVLKARISELKADMKTAAEALEAIDEMLFAIEDFVRFKCRFVEDGVNDMFRVASFRLFREQANGGVEERCDAQQGGVPYQGLNNGMKINVGIDIINALSRHYGVTVPLFVDNAEAVTKLEDCRSQVIRLVVSENDKELRMV